jgi:UDP-N-acetylmuramate dehydrogenase
MMAQLATQAKLLINEPMERYTSWRVGGPADRVLIPDTLEGLLLFLKEVDAMSP